MIILSQSTQIKILLIALVCAVLCAFTLFGVTLFVQKSKQIKQEMEITYYKTQISNQNKNIKNMLNQHEITATLLNKYYKLSVEQNKLVQKYDLIKQEEKGKKRKG